MEQDLLSEYFVKKFYLSYKTIKWLSFIALAALLLPLLLLGRYAVPAADDFSYGAPAHLAFVESGSVLAAAAAAADKTAESYMSWQGTFAAIFLMAMQPAVFSEALYALTPLIMLAALIIGTFVFCRAFFAELLGLDKDLGDIIAALLCTLSTQLIPSPVQGFYWFNGAVYYVFFHGLMLLACAVGIRLVKSGGHFRAAALCVLALFIGGGNYVTALCSAILVVCALLLLWFEKNPCWRRLVLPAIVLFAAFALSIAAPGNAVRQAAQEDSLGPVQAVLSSFACGVKYAAQWFSLPVIGGLLFLGTLIWSPCRDCACVFRFPALVSLFSFCLFSAMFCPPLYAIGNIGDTRLLNIVYFSYLLLLAANLVYWLGWLSKRRGSRERRPLSAPQLFAGILALLLCCGLAVLRGSSFTTLGALSALMSGEAKEYHACAQRRFEVLKDTSIEDAELERFPCRPYLLCFDDITEDPTDWRNVDMATYYGKNSIVLK